MYEVKVNYSLFTIVQSSNLRDKLEEICVNMDKVMVALIDAVSMYPIIKLKKFNRAVRYFTKGITALIKKTINI